MIAPRADTRERPEPDAAPPEDAESRPSGEATRRTHLANERTYLACWRSGLTALAVSVAIGKLVPQLSKQHAGVVSGATRIAFALLGLLTIAIVVRAL